MRIIDYLIGTIGIGLLFCGGALMDSANMLLPLGMVLASIPFLLWVGKKVNDEEL